MPTKPKAQPEIYKYNDDQLEVRRLRKIVNRLEGTVDKILIEIACIKNFLAEPDDPEDEFINVERELAEAIEEVCGKGSDDDVRNS